MPAERSEVEMHFAHGYVTILFALVFCCSVRGFPDGGPVDACVKPRPNQPYHGQARSQPLNTSPYKILASSSQYGPNSQITGRWDTRCLNPFVDFNVCVFFCSKDETIEVCHCRVQNNFFYIKNSSWFLSQICASHFSQRNSRFRTIWSIKCNCEMRQTSTTAAVRRLMEQ